MADRVISYDFRANFTNLTAGLASAGASVNAFGGKLTALDANGAKMRAGLSTLGSAAGKVGLVAAAGLGAAVLASANFEQAMSKVQAATGESAQAMGELRQAALEAGAETVFSASEAAAGMEALSKAGVATSDILNGGLTGALDLAAAGELAVADAAEIAATTMTQFGLAGQDVGHIADVLSAAAGKAQGSVQDMAGALQYVGPVAAQMGISLEETGGAIAYLATQGIVGQQAGTSLRGMLTGLTSPSKIAKEQMEALGISMYDASGQFIGLDGLAGQLQESMSKLTVAERDEALGRIFGNEQITAARILYAGGSDAITEWTGKVDDSGFAAEQAATKLDNLKGDLEALKGSLETALIGTGDGSSGVLREMTQGVTGLVNAFNDLPGPAKSAAGGLLAITAITGGALWFGSKVVGGIVATNAALKALGIQAQITAGSLRAAAGGLTVLALGTGYVMDSMDIVDSMGRSKDAADAYSNSVLSLAAALQDSNVGKYANDLGINIQLLAEDLYANGESGEYAAQVMADLEETGHGFDAWAKSSAGTIVPFWTDSASKAYDAGKDLDAIVGNLGDTLATLPDSVPSDSIWASFYGEADAADQAADATDGLAGAMSEADEATKQQAEALAAVREAASETANSFFDLTSKVEGNKATLSGWIKEMQDQADALANFTDNAIAAGENGVKQGLIDQLRELGPEGAKQMRWLANATDKEVARANAAWQRMEDAAENYSDAITGIPALNMKVQDAEGRKKIKQIQALVDRFGMTKAEARAFIRDAATDKVKAVQRLVDQYGATKAEARALLRDMASGDIAAVKAALRDLNGTTATTTIVTYRKTVGTGVGPAYRADGGQVLGPGTSTSDSIPAYLSNREYVIKAAAVDHYGVGFFDKANAMRLANGGYAGERDSGNRNDSLVDVGMFGILTGSLRDLSRALKESEKAVDKESRQRDNLISKRDELAGGIRGGLGGDIWAGASNPWMAGATANPTDLLNQQTTQAREFIKLIRSLKSKGLDGAALAEVIGSGDIERARMMAALSAKDLRGFEQAFNTNARVLQMAGNAGGVAMGYSAQIAESNKELRELRAEVRLLNREQDRREKAADKSRAKAADRAAEHNRRGAARAGRNRPNGG